MSQCIGFKGSEKLSEEEIRLISDLTADVANDMGEDAFQELLQKFKIKL